MHILLRCASVVILFAALIPRGVAGHERLLVVALTGVDQEVVESLMADGRLPALSSAAANGVNASIHGWKSSGRDHYWRTVFGGAGSRPSDEGPATVAGRYLWEQVIDRGGRAVVANVPIKLGDGELSPVGWRGADLDDDFIGSSSGVVLNAAIVLGRRLGWPYSMSAARVEAVADLLEIGHWSEWLEAETEKDSSKGVFKMYRIDADFFYLTPLYSMAPAGVPGDVRADTFSAVSTQTPEHIYAHAFELTEPKAVRARELAAEDWDLLVYFESMISAASFAYRSFVEGTEASRKGGREVPTAREGLDGAYAAADERIAKLLDEAGEGTCLALILQSADYAAHAGGDGDEGFSSLGTFIVSCGAGSQVTTSASLGDVAATLKYLSRLGRSGNRHGRPLVEVRTRYWTPASPTRTAAEASAKGDRLPATAETLHELGLVESSAGPS